MADRHGVARFAEYIEPYISLNGLCLALGMQFFGSFSVELSATRQLDIALCREIARILPVDPVPCILGLSIKWEYGLVGSRIPSIERLLAIWFPYILIVIAIEPVFMYAIAERAAHMKLGSSPP
jgi:hypothetical protein